MEERIQKLLEGSEDVVAWRGQADELLKLLRDADKQAIALKEVTKTLGDPLPKPACDAIREVNRAFSSVLAVVQALERATVRGEQALNSRMRSFGSSRTPTCSACRRWGPSSTLTCDPQPRLGGLSPELRRSGRFHGRPSTPLVWEPSLDVPSGAWSRRGG